jgi:hypothetical protein
MDLQEGDLEPLRSASILRAARALAAEGKPLNRTSMEGALGEGDDRRLLNEIAVGAVPTGGVAPGDCVRELRCVPLKARMAEIQRHLAGATGADEEALLSEKLQITRLMTSL